MDLATELISTLQALVKDRAPQKGNKALSQNVQKSPVIPKKDEPKIANAQEVTAYIKGLEANATVPGQLVNHWLN